MKLDLLPDTLVRSVAGSGSKGRVFALLIAILLWLALGCSDFGGPVDPEPGCEISAMSLRFGTVAPGDSATGQLELRNPGTSALSGAVGTLCSEFAVVSGAGPFGLPPGETLQILLRFVPADTGVRSCTLTLGTTCGPVSLTGTGRFQTSGAQCLLEPGTIEFGRIQVGGQSDRLVKLINTGLVNVIVDLVSACIDFEIVSGGGPSDIGPGDSLTAVVRFAPRSVGMFSCVLATGPDCPPLAVTGTGIASTSISFQSDIQPIFDNNCVVCHGSNGNAGLDLRSPESRDNLVNVTSTGYPPAVRVRPLDPGGSVLYGKVSGSGQYGQQMPPTGALSASDQGRIRIWIEEGADDN